MEKPSFVWRTRTTSDNLVIGHTDLRARCPGEDLCILRMSFEDDAYSTVNNWISQLDDGEPGVLAIFAPSANIIGTALVPANGLQILNEANSIVNHYSPFTAANFNGIPSPAIPGTIPAPQMPINVQHRSAHAPSAHSKSASSKLPSLVGFAIWVVHLQCSLFSGQMWLRQRLSSSRGKKRRMNATKRPLLWNGFEDRVFVCLAPPDGGTRTARQGLGGVCLGLCTNERT